MIYRLVTSAILLLATFNTYSQDFEDIFFINYQGDNKIYKPADSIEIRKHPLNVRVFSFLGSNQHDDNVNYDYVVYFLNHISEFKNIETIELCHCSIDLRRCNLNKLRKLKCMTFSSCDSIYFPSEFSENLESLFIQNSNVVNIDSVVWQHQKN